MPKFERVKREARPGEIIEIVKSDFEDQRYQPGDRFKVGHIRGTTDEHLQRNEFRVLTNNISEETMTLTTFRYVTARPIDANGRTNPADEPLCIYDTEYVVLQPIATDEPEPEPAPTSRIRKNTFRILLAAMFALIAIAIILTNINPA